MNENQVRLAKITCECPKCDKLFTMERYVDGPVDIDSCRVVCFNCIRRRVGSYMVRPFRPERLTSCINDSPTK